VTPPHADVVAQFLSALTCSDRAATIVDHRVPFDRHQRAMRYARAQHDDRATRDAM
jgi:hypothetical protein